MVVHIVDVLALQLIAIVVDFVLDVEREVGSRIKTFVFKFISVPAKWIKICSHRS